MSISRRRRAPDTSVSPVSLASPPGASAAIALSNTPITAAPPARPVTALPVYVQSAPPSEAHRGAPTTSTTPRLAQSLVPRTRPVPHSASAAPAQVLHAVAAASPSSTVTPPPPPVAAAGPPPRVAHAQVVSAGGGGGGGAGAVPVYTGPPPAVPTAIPTHQPANPPAVAGGAHPPAVVGGVNPPRPPTVRPTVEGMIADTNRQVFLLHDTAIIDAFFQAPARLKVVAQMANWCGPCHDFLPILTREIAPPPAFPHLSPLERLRNSSDQDLLVGIYESAQVPRGAEVTRPDGKKYQPYLPYPPIPLPTTGFPTIVVFPGRSAAERDRPPPPPDQRKFVDMMRGERQLVPFMRWLEKVSPGLMNSPSMAYLSPEVRRQAMQPAPPPPPPPPPSAPKPVPPHTQTAPPTAAPPPHNHHHHHPHHAHSAPPAAAPPAHSTPPSSASQWPATPGAWASESKYSSPPSSSSTAATHSRRRENTFMPSSIKASTAAQSSDRLEQVKKLLSIIPNLQDATATVKQPHSTLWSPDRANGSGGVSVETFWIYHYNPQLDHVPLQEKIRQYIEKATADFGIPWILQADPRAKVAAVIVRNRSVLLTVPVDIRYDGTYALNALEAWDRVMVASRAVPSQAPTTAATSAATMAGYPKHATNPFVPNYPPPPSTNGDHNNIWAWTGQTAVHSANPGGGVANAPSTAAAAAAAAAAIRRAPYPHVRS